MAKKQLPDDIREWFRQHGIRGGKIGGDRLAAMSTPAERRARAIKASKAAAVARSKKKRAKA